MRPNMDEYEDIDEPQPTNARAMSWMVLAVAIGGFSALAYYAYNSGGSSADGDVMIVDADGTPIKEMPADPEGEQFANKDKTIYDVITPEGEVSGGEKLLPEAERPVAATNTEDSEPAAPAVAEAPPSATTAPATPATTTYVAKEEAPVTVTEQPVAATAKTVEKSFDAPQIINEKKVVVKKDPVVKKPVAAKPATGGSSQVQLGAFKSEAEAQAAWKKISGAHSSVLSGAPTIVKAELSNGTFYRLRAGSYASTSAAKAACASISPQPCFPAK